MVGGSLSLPEDVERPEVDFVVDEDHLAGAVSRVDASHLLVLGVEVVEPPVHHSNAGGFGNRVVFARAQHDLKFGRIQR